MQDSSSSANMVVNNYMKGCLWEGIFTEYSAMQNTIVGNTVIANVTYDQVCRHSIHVQI